MSRNQSSAGPFADHHEVAERLRASPHQWGPVKVYRASYTAVNIGHVIRRGDLPAYAPAGHFEARTRLVDDGTLLEARYVGSLGPELARSGR